MSQKKAKRSGPVTVSCLSCPWTYSCSTWRPAKRMLAVHVALPHPMVVS